MRAGSWPAAAHACTPRLPAAARPRPPCAIEGRGAAAAAATAAARATARSEELTCAPLHSPSVPPRCIASSAVGKTDQTPRIRSRRRESPVRVHRRHARPRRQPRGACHRPDAAHGEWTDRPSARQPRRAYVTRSVAVPRWRPPLLPLRMPARRRLRSALPPPSSPREAVACSGGAGADTTGHEPWRCGREMSRDLGEMRAGDAGLVPSPPSTSCEESCRFRYCRPPAVASSCEEAEV